MSKVIYWLNSFSGASTLSGVAGSLITVLDDFLVNGINPISPDSIVVSGGVATVTKSAGHGFAALNSNVGAVVRVAGAVPGGLNGDWSATVVSSTQLSFSCPGVPDGVATGSITVRRAPLGWSKVYSATNKAVYRAPEGLRYYLRVDDTGGGSGGARDALITKYESMSDVDNGTDGVSMWWRKSGDANSSAVAWGLKGDSKTFYMLTQRTGYGAHLSGFGDFVSFKANDPHASMVIGKSVSEVSDNAANTFGAFDAVGTVRSFCKAARSYNGVSVGVSMGVSSGYGAFGQTCIGQYDLAVNAYPSGVVNGLMVTPVYLHEANNPRGYLRGLVNVLHPLSTTPLSVQGVALAPNHTFSRGAGFGSVGASYAIEWYDTTAWDW